MPYLIELLPGVLVAVSFFLLYRNLFLEKLTFHFIGAAFFFALASVGLSIIFEVIIQKVIQVNNQEWFKALFLSAIPEESSKFLFLYFYFKKEKIEHSLPEGIFYGILFGIFFGLIENFFYSLELDLWPMLVRSTTALPLHMLTGGILGSFILIYQNSNPRNFPVIELIFGFLLSISLHGFYNYNVFVSNNNLYYIPIVLFTGFFILEYLVMKSQNTLPAYVLELIGLKWDDYDMIHRFEQYLNWLDKDQEKYHTKNLPIIKFPKKRNLIFSFILLLIGFAFGFYFFSQPDSISITFPGIQYSEYISVFVFYPLFAGFLISFTGSLNAEYFQFKVLRIPIFVSVLLKSGDHEETSVVFFISRRGFYVPLVSPDKFQDELELEFWIGGKTIRGIKGHIHWKTNPRNDKEGGALIQFTNIPWSLVFYWNWALLKQRFKNLIGFF